jgi:hypothetical protein
LNDESKEYLPRCFQYFDELFKAKPEDSNIKFVATMGTIFTDSDVNQPRDNILLHARLIRMIVNVLKNEIF